MATLSPLAMSSTKDELLKHLNLPPETYALMAKETDRVYIWLTSEKSHLKANCKRKPPYDWSDIQEKSKDEAMAAIAQNGDEYTDYYWRLAAPTEDCPNWIARWFLYHKFRYRDGRNRAHLKGSEDRQHRHDSKQGKHHKSSGQSHGYEKQEYYQEGSMTAGVIPRNNHLGILGRSGLWQLAGTSGPDYQPVTSSSGYNEYNNEHAQQDDSGDAASTEGSQSAGNYYDPVRDV